MRLRVRYAKLGKIRWTSHRDVARMWERALRRTALPVAYSQGFSPRPRVSFGLALPTGASSMGEYLDIDLSEPLALGGLAERLSAALPDGLDVQAVADGSGAGSLQQDVTSCTWRLDLPQPPDELTRLVSAALSAPALVVRRERKGRVSEEDIKPAIRTLTAAGGAVVTELATQPRGLRPAELLDALGVDPLAAAVCRTHQWIERDGARQEPVLLEAPHAPHARERAS